MAKNKGNNGVVAAPVVEAADPSNMKSNSVMVSDIRGDTLMFTFRDGRELVLDAGKLADSVRTRAMMHGLKQKIGDAAAIARGDGGRSATLDDKYAAMMAVRDALVEGEWERRGEGMGTLLVRALAIVYPDKDRAKLAEWVKTKSTAERRALETRADVAAAIVQIAGSVDRSKLDAEIDAIG